MFSLRYFLIAIFWLSVTAYSFAQNTGIIRGTVRDKNTQETLVGVVVALEGTQTGVSTDENGNFKLENIAVGSYNVVATLVGYQSLTKYNINVTSGNDQIVSFELAEETNTLQEVSLTAEKQRSAAVADIITPLSVQSLSTEEIRANPGGNFDISKVVQALPGVGGTTGGGGFRNDIIIRGGAPNENVYYLDGIEIPVINHFSTQGSAGGPVGMLNVSFVEDVKLSTSAFDARYDNTLAAVLQFKQREGNPERISGNFRLSGTEIALTTEGKISPKTNFLASARRSYLQFLFQLIDLPIRPDYWDFQYKLTHKFNAKTTLTAIGIGAIDEFGFATPRQSTPESEYTLRSVPSIEQWNYTVGFGLKRLIENGYINIALSRNMFNNQLDRFEDKDIGNESKRLLGSRSQEIENKFRIDVNKFVNGWKFAFGAVGQYVKFNNDIFSRIRRNPDITFQYDTAIEFFRYGAFGQVSRAFFNNRLGISAGLRTDMNSFTDKGNNPLETLSPRLSISYALSEQWKVSGSVGSYFKMPIYTVLGYRNTAGELANRDARYTQSIHYVTGVEFLPKNSTRFTLEGFYKDYSRYPVSVRDGISLANQGGDFGATGNEKVVTNGLGRAYGLEFYFQQKLTKNLYAVFSYTFVRSEFAGNDGKFIASAWDNRHLISGIFGYKFKRGWELGLKHRFAGGSPYTPFDLEASRANYLSIGTGILDNSRLNTLRLGAFNQTDIRIDKKWNLKRFTFDFFIDIQNAFASKNPAFPQYTFQRNEDSSAFLSSDGQPLQQNGSNAIPFILDNASGNVLPSLGFIVEF
jgi:hypothetical protein